MWNHLPVIESWVAAAVNATLKATVLLSVAAVAVVAELRRASAAVRHQLWGLTFLALLVLPIVGCFVPGVRLPIVPSGWQAAVLSPPAGGRMAGPSQPVEKLLPQFAEPSPTAAAQEGSHRDDCRRGRIGTRSCGNDEQAGNGKPSGRCDSNSGCVGLRGMDRGRLAGGGGCGRSCRWQSGCGATAGTERSLPLLEPEWRRLLARLTARLGLDRDVMLLVGDDEQMPMTFGWKKPYVVLPADALAWPEERRRGGAAARVGSCRADGRAVANGSPGWPGPAIGSIRLVWWGLRRMRTDREQACDDCVLAAGQRASTYATHLLDIARASSSRVALASAALSMARRSQLEGRLLAVLDARRTPVRSVAAAPSAWPRRPSRRWRSWLAYCAACMREEAIAMAADNDQPSAPASIRPKQADDNTVVTGRVLSPQGKPVAGRIGRAGGDGEPTSGWPVYRRRKQTIDYRRQRQMSRPLRITFPSVPLGNLPAACGCLPRPRDFRRARFG